MPKYIIYSLGSLEDGKDDIYIGSVIGSYEELNIRMQKHRAGVNNPKDKGYNQLVHKYIRNNGGFFKHGDEKTNYSIIEFFKSKYNFERLERQKYWIKRLGATLNSQVPISRGGREKCIHKMEKYRCDECKGKILYTELDPDDYCIKHNRLVYTCPECKPTWCIHEKPLENCKKCWELHHK